MHNEFSNAERAEVLTAALPYIKKYSGKVVVIKYGGNAMINPQLKEQVMEDIALLWLIGVKVVLVHGGGPEITDIMAKLGKQAKDAGLLVKNYAVSADFLANDVDVEVEPEIKNGCLLVDIHYTVAATNSRDNFVFPFYLNAAREESGL